MSASIHESNRNLPRHRRFRLPVPLVMTPGRHRFEEGTVCPTTGHRMGATAAQHAAPNVIRRHGGDLDVIRVRRAR